MSKLLDLLMAEKSDEFDYVYQHSAELIEELLDEWGCRQTFLAEIMNLPRSSITNVKKGRRKIPPVALRNLVEYEKERSARIFYKKFEQEEQAITRRGATALVATDSNEELELSEEQAVQPRLIDRNETTTEPKTLGRPPSGECYVKVTVHLKPQNRELIFRAGKYLGSDWLRQLLDWRETITDEQFAKIRKLVANANQMSNAEIAQEIRNLSVVRVFNTHRLTNMDTDKETAMGKLFERLVNGNNDDFEYVLDHGKELMEELLYEKT